MKYLGFLFIVGVLVGIPLYVFQPWQHRAIMMQGDPSINQVIWVEDGASFECGSIFGGLEGIDPTWNAYSSHDLFTNKRFITREQAVNYVHKYCTD